MEEAGGSARMAGNRPLPELPDQAHPQPTRRPSADHGSDPDLTASTDWEAVGPGSDRRVGSGGRRL